MSNTLSVSDPGTLNLLLEKVYRDGGYDFREYKNGTVLRRLERRLRATGAASYAEYTRLLDTCPEEYERLVGSLTITVSSFFRSRYSFRQLTGLVLPELLSHKKIRGERSLRFWSAACARGEEPYSIAITLDSFLKSRPGEFDIQIYATDINRPALEEAGAGAYSSRELENLDDGTLAEYFTPCQHGHKVSDNIRNAVRFTRFDLAANTEPPFRKIDCIFCCNVLIYLQKTLQERVFAMLYEALADPGYLILGEVETPTDSVRGKLYCLDSKAKIYKKNGGGDDDR